MVDRAQSVSTHACAIRDDRSNRAGSCTAATRLAIAARLGADSMSYTRKGKPPTSRTCRASPPVASIDTV